MNSSIQFELIKARQAAEECQQVLRLRFDQREMATVTVQVPAINWMDRNRSGRSSPPSSSSLPINLDVLLVPEAPEFTSLRPILKLTRVEMNLESGSDFWKDQMVVVVEQLTSTATECVYNQNVKRMRYW